MKGNRVDGGVLRLDVAPRGEVTWMVGGEGIIPDDATPEDSEDVCGRTGWYGLAIFSGLSGDGIGGGGELGGGGGGGDLGAPVFVYCVVGGEDRGGGNISILSTNRNLCRGRSLGDGREYFSGFSKDVSSGVGGRFTLL
jgi:hypothetical protein